MKEKNKNKSKPYWEKLICVNMTAKCKNISGQFYKFG
jgi:hypothetical protein